jgi:hypothetical protein
MSFRIISALALVIGNSIANNTAAFGVASGGEFRGDGFQHPPFRGGWIARRAFGCGRSARWTK